MTPTMIGGLVLADFRDRVRRPAYAVTLLAAVGLGYVAAPDADARWVVMYIGNHRGVYNSAYIGTLIAFASALWLTLGGFYVVRSAIARDESTGVGQLLAATPVRTVSYLAGKFLSNCLILTSMVGVLAVTALVLQLARGESRSIDLVELLKPFVLIALPLVALTAAAALLFEAIPLLRSGLGNILWFGVWLIIAIGGQGPGAPFGGIGVHAAAASMRRSMVEQGIDISGGDFSLGLVYLDNPLRTFVWNGLDVTSGFVAGRLVLVLVSIGLALLPMLWFTRFDPARAGAGATVPAPDAAVGNQPVEAPAYTGTTLSGPATAVLVRSTDAAVGVLPRTKPKRGSTLGGLLSGELRILVQGISRWWWLGLLAITAAGLVMPFNGVVLVVLPLAWIWPILIWSRLGTQQHDYGVDALIGAYPLVRRRLVAEWGAGIVLTAVAGLAPAVRMVVAADWPGLAAWGGGMLFIPSVALALGVLSRSNRLFQALYLMWWYAVVNGIAFLDFMGAVREDGRPAGPSVILIAAAALALLGSAIVTIAARRNIRT